MNRVYLSVRWFDSTCRHFFKINVDGVHLEYYNNGKTTPFSLSGRGNNDYDSAESAARNKTIDTTSASQIKGRHEHQLVVIINPIIMNFITL